MISVKCNRKEYEAAVDRFHLDPRGMREEMEKAVVFERFFDDDYSWDQLFSKHAEMDPQMELDARADTAADLAEKEGRRLAGEAVRSLASLVGAFSRKREYGYDFLRHFLTDFYVPLVKKTQEEWISDASGCREEVSDQSLRLSILTDKVRTAPRLGGSRESLTLDFLEGADDYLTAVTRLRIRENLIRVMSTILSYCSRMMPDEAEAILGHGQESGEKERPGGPVRKEAAGGTGEIPPETLRTGRQDRNGPAVRGEEKPETAGRRLAFPRRLTMTTDDGSEYTVEASDGEQRLFRAGLTPDEALAAIRTWMK